MTPLDQIAEALLGLPPRLRVGNYGRVVTLLARPVQAAEDAIAEVAAALSLLGSKAPLSALRALGRRVGFELPPGFTAKEYRTFIRAQAAAVLSSGTWWQVQGVADLLRPEGVINRAKVIRLPPDHLQVEVPGLPKTHLTVARTILRKAIRLQDEFDLVPTGAVYFTFEIGPGFDEGILAP